jgi:hypothetical protein
VRHQGADRCTGAALAWCAKVYLPVATALAERQLQVRLNGAPRGAEYRTIYDGPSRAARQELLIHPFFGLIAKIVGTYGLGELAARLPPHAPSHTLVQAARRAPHV